MSLVTKQGATESRRVENGIPRRRFLVDPRPNHRSTMRSSLRRDPRCCSSYIAVFAVDSIVECTIEHARRLYYSLSTASLFSECQECVLSPYVFVTVLKRWWGTTRYLYAAWCPTRAAVVLRPTAG